MLLGLQQWRFVFWLQGRVQGRAGHVLYCNKDVHTNRIRCKNDVGMLVDEFSCWIPSRFEERRLTCAKILIVLFWLFFVSSFGMKIEKRFSHVGRCFVLWRCEYCRCGDVEFCHELDSKLNRCSLKSRWE